MSCPTPKALVAYLERVSSAAVADELGHHLAECRKCQRALAHLDAVRRTLAASTLPADPAFAASVMRNLPGRSPQRWWFGGLVAAGAIAAALFVVVVRQSPTDQSVSGLVARGTSTTAPSSRLGVDIFIHRRGDPAMRQALAGGETLLPGDGLSFVLYNRTGHEVYLCLFAIDHARTVHWFYPAFVDAQSDPPAVKVLAEPAVQALPEGVTPEGVAPGPLSIVALFLNRAVTVSDVERVVTDGAVTQWAQTLPLMTQEVRVLTSLTTRP